MTDPITSDVLRDMNLIDVALVDTIRRVLAGEPAAADPADLVMRRLTAERVLAAAETLSGLIGREQPRVEGFMP